MSGIRIVGQMLLGLEQAVKDAHKEVCATCHMRGSTLGKKNVKLKKGFF